MNVINGLKVIGCLRPSTFNLRTTTSLVITVTPKPFTVVLEVGVSQTASDAVQLGRGQRGEELGPDWFGGGAGDGWTGGVLLGPRPIVWGVGGLRPRRHIPPLSAHTHSDIRVT